MASDLEPLWNLLADDPEGPVFNPWYEHDRHHDRTPQAPEHRRANLRAYLERRQGAAKMLLVGEALGYQGGHFSGLAMTSERILLGHHSGRGLDPESLGLDLPVARTSLESVKKKGFSEPTATIVWGALRELGLPGREVVIWNAFPWHPYDPERGYLSNRRLTRGELELGRPALRAVRAMFPAAKVGAVGRVAQGELQDLGVDFRALRHPAHGGATEFRKGLEAWIERT